MKALSQISVSQKGKTPFVLFYHLKLLLSIKRLLPKNVTKGEGHVTGSVVLCHGSSS